MDCFNINCHNDLKTTFSWPTNEMEADQTETALNDFPGSVFIFPSPKIMDSHAQLEFP